MSFWAQIANLFLGVVIPAVERSSPVLRNIASAAIQIETGGQVHVQTPLGMLSIAKAPDAASVPSAPPVNAPPVNGFGQPPAAQGQS